LAASFSPPSPGVVVGDADQDEQARLGDGPDGLPSVHRHAGLVTWL
jgi:hypothetical protein